MTPKARNARVCGVKLLAKIREERAVANNLPSAQDALVRLADLATPIREASRGKIQKGSAQRSVTMLTLQF